MSGKPYLKEETNVQPQNNKHQKNKNQQRELKRHQPIITTKTSNDYKNCKIHKTLRYSSFDWLLDAMKEWLLLKV